MTQSRNLLNGVNLRSLRLLVAAAEEGNLARVAEREGIAISAVSRRISEFENRYGFAMFDRHDRGVTPTPDGRQFLDRIAVALGELEQIASDLLDRRDGSAGTVRVYAHTSSVTAGLPASIAEFSRQNPEIDVVLAERTSQEIVHAVQSAQCEIGLISGTLELSGLETTQLQGDELVVVLPKDSPLAGQGALSLRDLAQQPFICMQPGSALLSLYRTQAAAQEFEFNERVHCASFENVRACVAAGLGVSILPSNAVPEDEHARLLAIRKLSEPWAQRSLMICHRSTDKISSASRRFIAFLQEKNSARA